MKNGIIDGLKIVRWRNGRRKIEYSKVATPLQFTGSNPVLTTRSETDNG